MSDFSLELHQPISSAIPVSKNLKAKRYQGTYRIVPKVEWLSLLAKEFGQPDWEQLYPVNKNKGEISTVTGNMIYTDLATKSQLLSPRMACKLFHDGLYLIKKGEESPKFIQDRIPEVAHKCFKKKQWRKQFYEAMRRVCCRLAIGLGFRPNCLAEDAFIHAILAMSFELGWRRIAEYTDSLPEWEKDKDFSRVLKFGANEEVGNLLKGNEVAPNIVPSKSKSKVVSASDPKLKTDVKLGWFRCYDASVSHMFDHIVQIYEEDTDDWSIDTGSSSASSYDLNTNHRDRLRADSMVSNASVDSNEDFITTTEQLQCQHSPIRCMKASIQPSLSGIFEIPNVLSSTNLNEL